MHLGSRPETANIQPIISNAYALVSFCIEAVPGVSSGLIMVRFWQQCVVGANESLGLSLGH